MARALPTATSSCPLTLLLAFMCALRASTTLAAPGDGLPGSAHDFGRVVASSDATRGYLCSACHVPRSASSTRLLWDPSAERDSVPQHAQTAKGTYSGPSARCLSCHDGTVADGDAGGYRESHPVPMPYPYRNVASTYNGMRTGQPLLDEEWVADPTSRNIRLYSEDGRGNVVGAPRFGATGIECSSCHDPHNRFARDRSLLRGTVLGTRASGYLCLQCHAGS